MAYGRKKQRLTMIIAAGTVLSIAVGLALVALSNQIVFFKSPSDIAEEGLDVGVKTRLGGLVLPGSISHNGQTVSFVVTDTGHDMPATYTGVLPDLFREGQGVVIEGALDESGVFVAQTVLAKHDENYMPKEVADALKEQGVWQGGMPEL